MCFHRQAYLNSLCLNTAFFFFLNKWKVSDNPQLGQSVSTIVPTVLFLIKVCTLFFRHKAVAYLMD